jgi:hypothetical protein
LDHQTSGRQRLHRHSRRLEEGVAAAAYRLPSTGNGEIALFATGFLPHFIFQQKLSQNSFFLIRIHRPAECIQDNPREPRSFSIIAYFYSSAVCAQSISGAPGLFQISTFCDKLKRKLEWRQGIQKLAELWEQLRERVRHRYEDKGKWHGKWHGNSK